MPSPLKVVTFSNTGGTASHPSATVDVNADYKILCGGAKVSTPTGNFLTASYPTSIFRWAARSKDQDTPTPAAITVYAIALYDPTDQYDVQIFSATSLDPTDVATVTVTLPPGYQLVGGGAQANWGSAGQFLTISAPLPDLTGWQARSQRHLHTDPGMVTAFAIGLRHRGSAAIIPTLLFTDSSDTPASNPQADVGVGSGYTLIGGGAIGSDGALPFPWVPQGNMLTASYPQDLGSGNVEWQVNSHDQDQADLETITAVAIGANLGI